VATGFEDDAPIEAPAPKRPGKPAMAQPDPDKPAERAHVVPESKPAEIEAENLVALAGDTPLAVLQSAEKRDKLYAEIRKLISEQKPDLSTQAGRDRVKSFVYKITRTRTAMDGAGKAFTEQAREIINGVNKMRNDSEAAFKLLEAEARQPLTDWEEEQERQANARKEILQQLARAAAAHMPAPDLKDLQVEIESLQLDPDLWGEQLQMVTDRQAEVVGMIDAKIMAAEAEQRAAQAEAELERQRQAQPANQADQTPATLQPVIERQELPPPIASGAPPAAEPGAKVLTPTQQARRLVLPVLTGMGIEEKTAKDLILAIEAGKLPGVVAAYVEK
jgi:hypothetical protein